MFDQFVIHESSLMEWNLGVKFLKDLTLTKYN